MPTYQGLKGTPVRRWLSFVVNDPHSPSLQSAQLRKMFMERVSSMPLYGSVQLPVQYANNSSIWTRYTLSITQKGLQLTEGYSTAPVRSWTHSDIVGFTPTTSYFIFLTGTLLNAQREVLETTHPRLLSEIYAAFLKAAHNNG
jgi:hypothetical protein